MPDNDRPKEVLPYKMRRPELARDDAWIIEFLGRVQVGHIATESDGQPFLTPTIFWYDPERHAIYFHSNINGRVRTNLENNPRVCFEACELGKLLPSNIALEFSLQYESVMAFGRVRVVEDPSEARHALHGLITRYFPGMTPGQEYRPATDKELARTSVYALSINNWTGKRNWKERAKQSPDWAPLGE